MYVLEFVGTDDALAAREAASACSGVAVLAPGLATAEDVDRVAGLAYTRRAIELVGRCEPSLSAARDLLGSARLDHGGQNDDQSDTSEGGGGVADDRDGVADDRGDAPDGRDGAPDDRGGTPGDRRDTVAVRARDVRGLTGVDTQAVEEELGQELVECGFAVDLEAPDRELWAFFSSSTCAVGWLEAESRRDFGRRRPTDRPFFQPGSMAPQLARCLANIAGARPGARILDPMCGTGGILVEAGLVGATVLGVDAQWKMVRGARENLAHYLDSPGSVCRGDATRLPVRDDAVDGVVFDAPYGRQSKIAGRSLEGLVADALAEARRVTRGRGVVVGDRPWTDVATRAGWTVESTFERPVHRSLTRHVLVIR